MLTQRNISPPSLEKQGLDVGFSLDIDPVTLFPRCRKELTDLQVIKTGKISDSGQLAEDCESYLKTIIKMIYLPGQPVCQRVALALCVLDILEEQPDIYSASAHEVKTFQENLLCFLRTVCNKESISGIMREDLKLRLQVDPYYLPNHLPPHLSPPEPGQSHKAYLHKRFNEHLLARKSGLLLKLVDTQLWQEAIPKEALTFFRSGKHQEWSTRELSDAEQSLFDTYDYMLKEMDEEFTSKLDKVQYLDAGSRDEYRVFVAGGCVQKIVFHPENQDHPFKMLPASTKDFSSHDKPGMACFVINSRGELYIASHAEDEFHHSSFMAGGDLIFSGEIRINDRGQVEGITAYSGHYQPDIKAMYRCYQLLKQRGLDLSQCTFSLMDREAMMKEFRRHCFLDRNFERKVNENDPGVTSILTDITNKSMKVLTETDLLTQAKPLFQSQQKLSLS